jgi:hypothetical protein
MSTGYKNILSTNSIMTREEVLTQQGWEKQDIYDEPRLSEIIELYEEMGLEVHLEPFNPDEETGCVECMKVTPEKFKTVYTRKRTG